MGTFSDLSGLAAPPIIQKLTKDLEVLFAVVRGCQVGLKNEEGQFIKKGWKIMTTHPLIASRMDLPCNCNPQTIHVTCQGSLTKNTAYYTRPLARRVCEAMLLVGDTKILRGELQGQSMFGDLFGLGTTCVCQEGTYHEANLTCGHCTQGPIEDQSLVAAKRETDMKTFLKTEDIQRRLYLLHAATGHGQLRNLIQTLKRRNVPEQVLREAEKFVCPVCEERKRPQPRNMASLEPLPDRFSTLSADVGHWHHPETKEKWQFLLMVDEGSRFRVGKCISQGKHKHISAPQFITTLREAWIQYFGYPQSLRLDPDGAFRSRVL